MDELKVRLKREAADRAWELKCLRLHHLSGLLHHFAMSPQTTEGETLVELAEAIRLVTAGETTGALAPWIAAGLPERVASPLGQLRGQETRIRLRGQSPRSGRYPGRRKPTIEVT